MPIDCLVIWFMLIAALSLVSARAWAYVVFLALLEIAWVAACYLYARLGLWANDLSLLYWALAWLVSAAVELALGAITAISYAQSTGQSTLA